MTMAFRVRRSARESSTSRGIAETTASAVG
jgi:hypothetical protein